MPPYVRGKCLEDTACITSTNDRSVSFLPPCVCTCSLWKGIMAVFDLCTDVISLWSKRGLCIHWLPRIIPGNSLHFSCRPPFLPRSDPILSFSPHSQYNFFTSKPFQRAKHKPNCATILHFRGHWNIVLSLISTASPTHYTTGTAFTLPSYVVRPGQ